MCAKYCEFAIKEALRQKRTCTNHATVFKGVINIMNTIRGKCVALNVMCFPHERGAKGLVKSKCGVFVKQY